MSDQERVAAFVAQHNLEADPQTRLLDLTSELGEVAKELLKATQYGTQSFNLAALPAAWAEEMGDLYFALLCLANTTQVDLSAALEGVLAKYAARMAAKGGAGSDGG